MSKLPTGPCQSCHRPVRWVLSAANGVPMPLDREPDDVRGNVLVDGFGKAHVFRSRLAAIAFQEEFPDHDCALSATYISHHATCPHGKSWEGKQRDSRQESLL